MVFAGAGRRATLMSRVVLACVAIAGVGLLGCESTTAEQRDGAVDLKVTDDGPQPDLGPSFDSALADLLLLDDLGPKRVED